MERKKLNIIDCPGVMTLLGTAITALNVTDTAILLLNGQYGPKWVHRIISVILKNWVSR